MKIMVEEVDKLHIHEEIIPGILNWLVEKIRRDNFFKDPVIVDEKTLVVLDGMHRMAAAREIALKYIPVCLVDYDNNSIELHAWGRVIESGELKNVLEAFNRGGFKLSPIEGFDAGSRLLNARKALGLLVTLRGLYVIEEGGGDIKRIYDHIKEIEMRLQEKGFKISYMTEQDSIQAVRSGKAVASLIPPVITKREVREVALRGEVFTHKATRHVIPARPLNVNIPLDWLKGGMTKEEVNSRVKWLLATRSVRKLPPGTVLDRRYDEELFVFE